MKIDQKLSNFVNQIAVDAGKEILKIYNKPFTSKMKKDKYGENWPILGICQGLEVISVY